MQKYYRDMIEVILVQDDGLQFRKWGEFIEGTCQDLKKCGKKTGLEKITHIGWMLEQIEMRLTAAKYNFEQLHILTKNMYGEV